MLEKAVWCSGKLCASTLHGSYREGFVVESKLPSNFESITIDNRFALSPENEIFRGCDVHTM